MLPLFSLQKITQSSATTWVTKFCLYINKIIMQPSKSWELVTACALASFPVWFLWHKKTGRDSKFSSSIPPTHLSTSSASLSSQLLCPVNNRRITGSDKAILLKTKRWPSQPLDFMLSLFKKKKKKVLKRWYTNVTHFQLRTGAVCGQSKAII